MQLIVTLRHALITFREFVYHEVINRLESLALAEWFLFFHVPRPLTTAVALDMKLACTHN